MTDQLPSVADFLVAVSSVSTQGRHTPAVKHEPYVLDIMLLYSDTFQDMGALNNWLIKKSMLSGPFSMEAETRAFQKAEKSNMNK